MVNNAIKIEWFTGIAFIKYLKIMTKRIFFILKFKEYETSWPKSNHCKPKRIIKELKNPSLQIFYRYIGHHKESTNQN